LIESAVGKSITIHVKVGETEAFIYNEYKFECLP
jgi:hypothetical protein